MLTGLESILYQIEYSSIVRLFQNADYTNLLVVVSFYLLTSALTIFFIWTALVSNYDYRIIYFVLFSLAVSTEFGYLSVFERFSSPADFDNAVFASDLSTKIRAILGYFDWRALIPCTLFGLLIVIVKPVIQRGWILFSLNIFLILSIFSVSANFVVINYNTNSFAAYYRTIITGTWYFFNQSDFISPREDPTFFSKVDPTNNIVFIGDESIRADHLSLNGYKRDTTPLLINLEKKGLLLNWGIAVSATTESVNSNRVLISGLKDLPDKDNKIYRMTSIFQYAKAMGYKTFYFDGQSNSTWNGSKYDTNDFGEITVADDYKTEHKYNIDGEIAERVRKIVSSSKGNFVWISKRGNHFPYELNYPENAKIWNPIEYDSDKFKGESKNIPLINNYDNAIKYNFELFFKHLFSDGIAKNTIYFYTSDHGQSLVEGKASHTSNTRNEAQVPIFLIANKEDMPKADTDYKATHANLFPTLLDLMKYPENERKYNYALSLLKARSSDSNTRYYYAGNIFNEFQGELLKYDK